LAPDERLAALITRRGRFRKLDPRKGRPLPPISRLLAVLAWAGVVGMSFRRAVRQARAEH